MQQPRLNCASSRRAALVAAILVVLCATPVFAGGVGILENGGKRMGNAWAGGAAEADDATTIWWNPAGMTRLRRPQVVLSAHVILPDLSYADAGSVAPSGAPMLGGLGGNGGDTAVVPNFFASWAINPCWRAGLGVNAPFGLSTKYPSDWIGRYHATRSEITNLNINPSVAYRVNRQLSVGAGFNANYLDATIDNQIDFGALVGASQALDGSVSVNGDDWGFGWNAGLLWEPNACTRFGVHYRSRISHTLRGTGDFTVPAAASRLSAATGRFVDSPVTADVELPDSLSASAYRRLNSRWSVMADVTWTNWSTLDALIVDFENPAEPDSVLPLDWKDTVRFGVGVSFEVNRCVTLRGGLMFDPRAVPTSTRTPRVPGNDRFWVTAGAGYRVNKRLRLDFSYAHLFVPDSAIRQPATPPARGSLVGEFDSSVDILAVQLTLDL
ncbi:MAG: aromatic hydrocarbon degradation protein [bacterium]|nr:aromatic hydrocarbon degradation protein [bacterium]